MRYALVPAAIALSFAPLYAGVIVVDAAGGPGADFTSLQAAVDAALPGDALLVRSGSYGKVSIDGKGISVIADAGASVLLGPEVLSMSVVQNVPADQSVVLRGLSFSSHGMFFGSSYFVGVTVLVADCDGPVLFDACTIALGKPSLRIENCATVVLHGSDVTGGSHTGGAAVGSADSAVFAYESTFVGDDGQDAGQGAWAGTYKPSFPGATGWRLESGELFLSGCDVIGGQGGNGYSSFQCVVGPSGGGDGLVLGPGAPLARLANTFPVAGAPGTSSTCPPPATTGQPILVFGVGASAIALAGEPPMLVGPPTVREGQTYAGTVQGSAGHLGFLLVGPASTGAYLPPFSSALVLGPPLTVVPIGALSPLATASFAIPVGELGLGVEGVVVLLQAATCDPIAGGCSLGSASALLALDAAL